MGRRVQRIDRVDLWLIMVRLFFSRHGKREVWEVPFHKARHVNRQLFLEGAAVYWSEVC